MKGFLFLKVIILSAFLACNNQPGKETAMLDTPGDNIILTTLHTYIDSLWNKKDTSFLKRICSSQFERNLNGIKVADNQREMLSHLNVFFTAFPDLKTNLEQAYVQDGKASILWSTEGTNTGIFGEVPPTGKKMKINGMTQMYFNEKGKLYREDVYFNELDMLQQLGYTLIPPVLK